MSTRLGQIAERHHWTSRDAIREFEAAARRIGETDARTASERQWKRWCSGECRPQPPACRVLEEMTGHPAADLFTTVEPALPAPRVTESFRGAMEDAKGMMAMATRRARDRIEAAETSNAGPELLAALRDDLGVIAQTYPRAPLPALLPDLIEVQNTLFRLLEARQPPDTQRDLYLYAGVASGIAAKAAHDLADPRAALTQARLAYVCATHSGHIGLRAWVRGLQSLIAYWADWPAEAVRYARAGVDDAGDLASSTGVWLAALEARALARLGQPGDATRALGRVADLRDTVRADDLDGLGGLLRFTLPRQRYYEADTAVLLPGTDAERAATDAVDALEHAAPEDESFSDLAGSRADLALARVRAGHVDGAAEALRPVLDLPVDQRIGGIIPSVQRVGRAFGRADTSPVVTGLVEEIEAYTRDRAPILPR